VQGTTPLSSAAGDEKSVGIAVGVIGLVIAAFMVITVAGLSYYHSIYYALR
jgi:hypothetical protein